MTQYVSKIYLKRLIDNIQRKSDNTAVKTSVEANTKAIETLNGDSTVEGSVKKAIKDVVGAAPEALDTLEEIAAQLNNDESAASALTNKIAAKANTTDVYSKTESDEKYQPKGNYLTEHQDLSSYAKLNDLSSYAKTNEVGVKVDTANNVDFAITDKNDNTLCIFEDGHIKTKNFDSSLLSTLFLNKFQGKTIAILGDSISTYTGWLPSDVAGYNGAKYEVYYPHGDVKSASDTWWYKVAVGLGMNPTTQISNCAWSGSKVTGDSTSTTSAAAGCSNRRITDLSLRLNGKAPDIIICYISCNDWGNGVAVGDWSVDSDVPSEGTISTFREAYALMLYKIHKAYPYARVFCCTNLDDTSRDRATSFPSNNSNAVSVKTWNNSIIEIAEAFGCDVINLHDCGINYANISNFVVDTGLHPNAVGHTLMARKIIAELFAKY